MARCLVTGGCGFIGAHLVEALVQAGHTVFVLDNQSNTSKERISQIAEMAVCYQGDINYPKDWEHAFIGVEYVFHTAAVSRTPWAVNDPVNCMFVNVIGSQRILECARGRRSDGRSSICYPKSPRVVLSSSNVVYAGETAYKVSKLAMEGLGAVYTDLYGLSVVSLRYSNVYGPRIQKGDPAVFAALRDHAREHGFFQVTGDGSQTRDFTHVKDIVRANMLAAFESDYTGVLDICTGVQTSINTACGLMNSYVPVAGYPIQYVGERAGDVSAIEQDPFTATKVLGWQHTIKLEDGIKDVWVAG